MQTVVRDLRYAARTLGRAPAYTAIAVLTLALGIGANTAIFSVIHGVLLEDLPFANGHRVVRLKQPVSARHVEDAGFSLRAKSRSLESETVEMTDRLHTVVGILPPLPAFPNENDVFMPVSSCPFRMSEFWLTGRTVRALTVFAGSRPGVERGAVRSDLGAIASQMHQEHSESYSTAQGFALGAESLLEELSGLARQTLVLLLATSALVLLIACANVANLTLVRLVHRRPELVVRAALGAGAGRLARQLLTESVVVAAAGAVVGVGLAAALLRVLVPYSHRAGSRRRCSRSSGCSR